jgi:hypothetical protein
MKGHRRMMIMVSVTRQIAGLIKTLTLGPEKLNIKYSIMFIMFWSSYLHFIFRHLRSCCMLSHRFTTHKHCTLFLAHIKPQINYIASPCLEVEV